jgi:hypothetical protein
MSDRQVLLQGGNWKRQLLICLLLIGIGVLILHLWIPGSISSFLANVYDIFASLYHSLGNFIEYLLEKT